MKNAVIYTLSALSAAGLFCASALADEPQELSSVKSGNVSSLSMKAGAEAPTSGFPVVDLSKVEPLGLRAVSNTARNVLVSGLSNATLVIDRASLVAGGDQLMLRSAIGQGGGSGFAPIKAALAAHPSDANAQEIRSAVPAAARSLYSAPK